MERGAGVAETPRNGTILGCEIRFQITTSLQKTFVDGQLQAPNGDRERWVSHLRDLSYVTVLVDTKGLYRDSFIIVNPLPNVAVATRGNGYLARLDEFVRYNVGNGKQSRSTTELAKPFERLHIVSGSRECLCRTVILRITAGKCTRFQGAPCQISPTTPSPCLRLLPGRRGSACIARGPRMRSGASWKGLRGSDREKAHQVGQ